MSHDVQQIKLMNNFFRTDPNFQKLPQLMKTKLKNLILKTLMEFSRLSRFRLKNQIFLNQSLNLLPRRYFSNILSNIDQRPIQFEFVVNQLRKYKLNLRVKFPNFQTFHISLLELPHNISIVRNHRLQKSTDNQKDTHSR